MSIVGGRLHANGLRLNEGRTRGSAFARDGEGEGEVLIQVRPKRNTYKNTNSGAAQT